MIYEINYKLYLFLAVVVTWPLVFFYLMIYDICKGNKIRPFYRLAWPFMILFELVS